MFECAGDLYARFFPLRIPLLKCVNLNIDYRI
jgi:hypothetical protein